MLSVFETGEARFRLSDRHDEDVGWIRGAAVGFDGFATEAEAVAAAVAGSSALTSHLERLTGAGSAGVRDAAAATGQPHVAYDGTYEWVARGKVPLARLYRPERDAVERQRRRTFGIEFVLPSYVKSGAAVGASLVIYRAITHGAADGVRQVVPTSASVPTSPAVAGVLERAAAR